MTYAPDAAEMTTNLVAMLARVTRLPVGDGRAPGSDQVNPTGAYLVVTVPGGGSTTGDGGNMASIRAVVVQVTGVGTRRDQAAMALQRAHDAILAQSATGWANSLAMARGAVMARAHIGDGGVLAEGGTFNAVGIYELTCTV